jgi:hypothetical protein
MPVWTSRLMQGVNSEIYETPIPITRFNQIEKTCIGEWNAGVTRLDERSDIFNSFIPWAPAGTRFWFFKHLNLELAKEEHLFYISNTNWVSKRYNDSSEAAFNKSMLDFENSNNRVNEMADRCAAGPWKDFDLQEYYGDNKIYPNPDVRVRLFIKS